LYPRDRSLDLLLAFQQADPDLIILLKDDFTRMELLGFYLKHSTTYRLDDDFSELTVYLRRREIPVNYVRLPGSAALPATK
jgi:hypothetical protein